MARPSKYKEEYCNTVVELMSQGASKTEVAAELGVSKQTLYSWMEKHEMFLDAIKRGSDLSEAWWEKAGRVNLFENTFNHVLWYMNMKNRFGWRDKQEVEHSGDMPTINIRVVDANSSD